MANETKRQWYNFSWYAAEDTKEERRFIKKLDLLIVPYAFISYWVKYIDQANLNNAYVAGMKEDLGFHGNELVQLQTLYIVGAVVGQLPFLFLFTYIPLNILIPFMDVCWGVGFFEAAFFPVMHYLFGSWYRGDEIGRRGGLFYVGLSLGTLTAGLIQAGASARLDGVNGLAGWRWMYIICALITIPIGILGYFVIPGTPDQPNRLVLTKEDVVIGEERLKRAGHQSHGKFQLRSLKGAFTRPQFWGIIIVDIFFWNAGLASGTGSFLLWIKSLNRFSQARVNELGTIAPALGIFYTLLVCFLSDLVLGPAWAITLAHVWNGIGLVILTTWNVPETAKWFAYATTYSSQAMSSVLHGWVNAQLRDAPAERAFTLVLINAISQSTTAWTPLLVYPTVEAPRFPKGFAFSLSCAIILIVLVHVLNTYLKRKEARTKSDLVRITGTPEAASLETQTVDNKK
ncbi:prephenate dehydrogenase [Apiospora arundinis]